MDTLRNAWCLGGESFRKKVLGLLDGASEKLRRRREVDGAVRRSHDEVEARRIIAVGLEHFGLRADDLPQLRKGDHRKLAMARVIRTRTAIPNAWVARELHLGHLSRLNHISSSHEKAIAEAACELLKTTGL